MRVRSASTTAAELPAGERSSPGPDRYRGQRRSLHAGQRRHRDARHERPEPERYLGAHLHRRDPHDERAITRALILDGNLNITQGAGFAQGTYTIFTATGAITNNSLRLGVAPSGFSYDYQVSGTNVLLKVGPPATSVEMVKLDAVSDGSSTQVTWEAGSELRNLGYRLYREENGTRREVSGLIAGSALRAGFDPLAGRNYALVIPPAAGAHATGSRRSTSAGRASGSAQ